MDCINGCGSMELVPDLRQEAVVLGITRVVYSDAYFCKKCGMIAGTVEQAGVIQEKLMKEVQS